ncbi:hypothetical protein O181_039268 [Austropuccinia psidii MF-1]|uniref:Reverse transcriptase domain-containing protein n=1 Tax=Austropuccinia psidii MF-1 TaxID=1389203 RepID=A0A9Q3HBT8_9BASI|nr:hypothetical protein [Austropuccinia psidii MF-1]
MDLPPSSYHDSLEELWDEEEEPEEVETMMKVVPSVYHQYLDVFSKVKAEKLPPHHACDHHIELEGSLPPVGPSSSSTGAPVLFVKKKDSGLRLCVDYRKLNAITRKNKYPVPPMNQLLNVFNSSSIFYKIYLHGAYNLLRIKEGNEHLTAFRTKYGSYEYSVMPFGLTNSLASFHNLVNDIFPDIVDVYVVAYLDYIMVFSKYEEDNVTHVSTVLSGLGANNLFSKASKWTKQNSSRFSIGHLQETSRLFNLSLALPVSTTISARIIKRKSVQSPVFLKKDSCFPLNEEALSHFHHHPNPSLPTIVETDSSDYALGAVLSPVSDSGKHPISFDSRKRIPAELNYVIHDKELLGLVSPLQHWRAFLLSLSSPFEVLTNHSSLQYFMSSKVLTLCQARWAEFLCDFDFSITYFPGCLATLTDRLSCWDNIYPERGEDFIRKNPMNFQQLIKQDEVQPSRYFAVKVELFSNLIDSIPKALWQDSQ